MGKNKTNTLDIDIKSLFAERKLRNGDCNLFESYFKFLSFAGSFNIKFILLFKIIFPTNMQVRLTNKLQIKLGKKTFQSIFDIYIIYSQRRYS